MSYLNKTTEAAPLAVFRILFGLLMVWSMVRFWYHGWIEKLYILPTFHFKYLGFGWVTIPGDWTYALFVICALSALCVALGLQYRLAIITFFLSFTYIELLDKTTYLNHYYFISVLSFVLIWLPMHCYFSLDAQQSKKISARYVPQWTVDVLKVLIAIVYIYAGLAKINSDWLLRAMPLSIWLPTKFDVPFLGSLMHEPWMHYLFSWGGMLYDLGIVFLLLFKRTRLWGFALVVLFHLMTRVLFPIGMFPYVMIISSLIFFEPSFHRTILEKFRALFLSNNRPEENNTLYSFTTPLEKMARPMITILIILQIIIPWRYLIYPGNIFWTEEGYRFSWRVMLMEKTGYAQFKIVDGKSEKSFYVQNENFLTAFQQKQMSTQPDFILEYAHYLGDHFSSQGHQNVEVYVDSYAAINGRPSQRFVDPAVNLMTVHRGIAHKDFILPLDE